MTHLTVDVAGLVDDGFLTLNALFSDAIWKRDGSPVASFIRCCYGPEGDAPGELEIIVECAVKYGIAVYRWTEIDAAGAYVSGDITLDRAEAVSAGEDYASENDEEPDADDLIQQIRETGYFGDAIAAEIKAVCEEATRYSQGYLLLPKGEFVGHPIGRMWTISGYLQCDHVRLTASKLSVAVAADELLRRILESVSADD